MGNKRIIFFLLTAYLVGNLLLIFIQYNWGKNLNTLIEGNEKLVNEFTVSGQLKELERDVLSVESRIRGTVTTEDTSFIRGLENEIVNIEANLDKVKNTSDNDSSDVYITLLDRLVHDKLQYGRSLIRLYKKEGKEAAEDQIATQIGRRLTDSIMITARNIEIARQRHLSKVATAVDASGANALHLGIILIASVLIAGAFVFWYIINTIRRQSGLIQQLNQSERKVREAAQVKENFLANMSHEIRTPLNAILGFTNLLQRKKELDSESRKHVQTIQRSGENLLTIINDILDLSKIEAGMMRIEPAPFSIRGLLHSVETMMQPRAVEKNLHLVTDVDRAVPDVVEGDAVRLTQILINLVGNAVKFTDQGRIEVRVKLLQQVNESYTIGFAVSDTGIGIEPGKLSSVFERFQQAESSVTRKYGGTGLGLAIVKDLVNLQGGDISVESTPGEGTTFRFAISYRSAPPEEAGEMTLPETAVPVLHLQHLQVLVVEDNEINQSLVQAIFRHWKVACVMANNGEEALQQLRSQAFDLVLMDIQMPVMDGYTATQKIRTELGLSVPIIAMTAHAMAGEREKCLSYGMNDYIAKPVREEQLYNLVRTLVPDAGSRNASQSATGPDAYQVIQLDYMREVSGGDAEYEKLVTGQFLALLPQGLTELAEAWQQGNVAVVQQTAHNMKTTVSVMGLNDRLDPLLQTLENGQLTTERFEETYAALKTICCSALQEARLFQQSLA